MSGSEPTPMLCSTRYSTVYTMFPVFSLVLDKDVKSEVAMLYPELYKDLLKVSPMEPPSAILFLLHPFSIFSLLLSPLILFPLPLPLHPPPFSFSSILSLLSLLSSSLPPFLFPLPSFYPISPSLLTPHPLFLSLPLSLPFPYLSSPPSQLFHTDSPHLILAHLDRMTFSAVPWARVVLGDHVVRHCPLDPPRTSFF